MSFALQQSDTPSVIDNWKAHTLCSVTAGGSRFRDRRTILIRSDTSIGVSNIPLVPSVTVMCC